MKKNNPTNLFSIILDLAFYQKVHLIQTNCYSIIVNVSLFDSSMDVVTLVLPEKSFSIIIIGRNPVYCSWGTNNPPPLFFIFI